MNTGFAAHYLVTSLQLYILKQCFLELKTTKSPQIRKVRAITCISGFLLYISLVQGSTINEAVGP